MPGEECGFEKGFRKDCLSMDHGRVKKENIYEVKVRNYVFGTKIGLQFTVDR